MADLRCQMCGETNPADQAVCQHCNARLKPLVVTPPDEDIADPLKEPSDSIEPKPVSMDLPDWLDDLRQPDQTDQTTSDTQKDSPDWLDGLRDQPVDIDTSRNAWSLDDDATAPTVSDATDWLDRIQEQEEDKGEPDQHDPDPGVVEERTSEEIATDDEIQSMPEWMPEPEESSQEPPAVAPKMGTGMLDWLSRDELISDEPEKSKLLEPGSIAGASDVPDWLTGGDDELPAWLSQESKAEPSAEVSEGEPDLPDWLSVEAPVSAAPETSKSPVEAEQDKPDWLMGEGEEPADGFLQESDPEPSAEVSEEEPDLPDWLSVEAPVSAAPETSKSPVEAEQDEPDWLTGEGEELPDWLLQEDEVSDPASEQAEIQAKAPEKLTAEDTVEPLADQEAEIEIPDWIAELPDSEPVVEEPSAVEEEGDLAWLDELESAYPEMLAEPSSQPSPSSDSAMPFIDLEADADELESVPDDDLPDWLSSAALAGTAIHAAGRGDRPDKEGAEIEPADLPDWLEAMRPVDDSLIGDRIGQVSDYVEGAGPLAGLRGVLPAEPGISYASKPPTYSTKIQASEIQQANAELLEQLLKVEGEAKPVPQRPAITSLQVLRIATFIVLSLATLIPLLLSVPQFTAPNYSPETLVMSKLIGDLPGRAFVLLAVDYEPGFSGEMEAAASAVLDHLMIKGAYLTMVSTSPIGPLQAERLIYAVNRSGGHQYRPSEHYVNLGYIPGGLVGLQSFVGATRQTMPYALDDSLVWQSEPLASVKSLTDFDMALVVTENPDTARAWIEQVQPALGNTPMVMVASAQAAPIIRPYYEATPKQIQGLMNGLAAGAVYENLLTRSGPASRYWTPFTLGSLVAILLIVVGGSINIVSALLSRNNERTEGGG